MTWCKPCHRQYYRDKPSDYFTGFQGKLRQKKREEVERIKIERGCAHCGEKHPACLEWHHRNPEEKDDVVNMLVQRNRPYDVIEAEMAKCDVLCCNCHRKLHWQLREHSKYASAEYRSRFEKEGIA